MRKVAVTEIPHILTGPQFCPEDMQAPGQLPTMDFRSIAAT